MVWCITYGLRQKGTSLRGFTIFVVVWFIFWGMIWLYMGIREVVDEEESAFTMIYVWMLGQTIFVGPFYIALQRWANKHRKTAKPPDFYINKSWTPDPTENQNNLKTCLSCGQMVDIRYSVCPFCKKPTAPKRPGGAAKPAYGASFGWKPEIVNKPVIIQNIGQFVAGDNISIRDSVIQRSSVGSGSVTPNELSSKDKTEVLEQYKSILHHVYGDGYVDRSEYKLLKMLREREDITGEDHALVEWEVLSEREDMGKDDGGMGEGKGREDGMGGGGATGAREENGMGGALEDW